ncbi:hypothetical protein GQ457_08G009590 [Hibiscus cannabinus]
MNKYPASDNEILKEGENPNKSEPTRLLSRVSELMKSCQIRIEVTPTSAVRPKPVPMENQSLKIEACFRPNRKRGSLRA